MQEIIPGGAWSPGQQAKHFFLPTASGESVDAPSPPEPAGRYPCPCCGFLTLPLPREEALAWICPVCLWENDVFAPDEDSPSDENQGQTLRQGRECFRRLGAVREDLVPLARPPKPEELPPEDSSRPDLPEPPDSIRSPLPL